MPAQGPGFIWRPWSGISRHAEAPSDQSDWLQGHESHINTPLKRHNCHFYDISSNFEWQMHSFQPGDSSRGNIMYIEGARYGGQMAAKFKTHHTPDSTMKAISLITRNFMVPRTQNWIFSKMWLVHNLTLTLLTMRTVPILPTRSPIYCNCLGGRSWNLL